MTSRLRESLVALGALLMLSSAAIAADQSIPVYKAVPDIAPTPVFSWTESYTGGHAGSGWYQSSYVDDEDSRNGRTSWVGGAQAGWNYQVRQFVFGPEGEYWWSALKNESTTTSSFPTFSETARNRSDWDLDRLVPARRGPPVEFRLPPIRTAADLISALGAALGAAAAGELTADEGSAIAGLIQTNRRVFELTEIESCVSELEKRSKEPPR